MSMEGQSWMSVSDSPLPPRARTPTPAMERGLLLALDDRPPPPTKPPATLPIGKASASRSLDHHPHHAHHRTPSPCVAHHLLGSKSLDKTTSASGFATSLDHQGSAAAAALSVHKMSPKRKSTPALDRISSTSSVPVEGRGRGVGGRGMGRDDSVGASAGNLTTVCLHAADILTSQIMAFSHMESNAALFAFCPFPVSFSVLSTDPYKKTFHH
jgi:hypothetical protein